MNKFAISCCRWITLVCIFYLLTGCQQRGPVTYLVVSDTHFGINDSVAHYNQALINQMNALPGTSYPESVGGEVEVPRGLLISGDLTDQGSSESWDSFTLLYGLSGNKELNYPVFEGFGNHDGLVGGAVRAGIQDRNRQRHGLTDISENDLHYSWDWEDIHFVNLNLYPSGEWDSTCAWCHYFEESFREPQGSLQFLEKDLLENIGNSDRPVVLYFHYGFGEWGYKWWTQAERDAFYDAIEPYNVLAIFYGHSHSVQVEEWRGIPVYCVGSTQKEAVPGEFMVVRITEQDMTVIARSSEGWGEQEVISLQADSN